MPSYGILRLGGDDDERLTDVVHTSNDRIVLAGNTNSFDVGSGDGWIVMLDNQKNILWQKAYGTSDIDEINSIIETADGNLVFAGSKNSVHLWLVKIDMSGAILWETHLRTGWAYKVLQTHDGGYITVGMGNGLGEGNDGWVVKFDSTGNMEWEKTIGRTFNPSYAFYDFVDDVIQLPGDDYILTGGTYHWTTYEYDLYIARFSSAGDLIWNKVFGGYPGIDLGGGLHYVNDNSIIVAGYTSNFGTYYDIPLVIEIDQNGILKSAYVYNSNTSFELNDFLMDPAGNILSLDDCVIKYNPINTVKFARQYVIANVALYTCVLDSFGLDQYVIAGEMHNQSGDLNYDWGFFIIDSDGSYADGVNAIPWDVTGSVIDISSSILTADSSVIVQENAPLVYAETINSTITDTIAITSNY